MKGTVMGGTTFYTEVSATDTPIDVAFERAVDDAQWEHGHGGYTGTIAEKSGYVEFTIPPGLSAQDVTKLLREYEEAAWNPHDADKPLAVEIPPGLDLKRMWEVYDDKWGPAVAFRSGDKWVFCGWASC